MRPKPLMPTFTANSDPFLGYAAAVACPGIEPISGHPAHRAGTGAEAPPTLLRAPGWFIHVSVHDLHHVVPALRVLAREALGDHHGAVAAAGAADADRQVRLALAQVVRQEVIEQRQQPLEELADAVRALDVVDHRLVLTGE